VTGGPIEIILPKLGMYEGDATLVDWLVADGAEVQVGDPLFVVETEKIETEVEADDPGFLVREQEPGFVAAVGTRVGCLVATRDDYDRLRPPERS
jgi:pyruvate/2-oxoglutarate dehydrogenase complex dihydrolipoamide acyltransferase (E2) component